MEALDLRVKGRYKLKRKVGQGGCGAVYLGTDLEDDKLVIVKLEKKSLWPSPMENERHIYEELGHGPGIAKMFGLFSQDYYKALVLELLGPALNDLVDFCEGCFSLKTTLMLADQMISRLEYLHSKDVLHRDVKPDNFLMGTKRSGNIVYITDFGLAMEGYSNLGEKRLRSREPLGFIGSHRFTSIRSHHKLCQTRRDDMESLGYTLLTLLRNKLPWDDISLDDEDAVELIGRRKESVSVEDLCAGAPKEFAAYFTHVRSLGFLSRPDYGYLRRLFRNLFVREGFEYDNVFDWTIRKFFMDQEAAKVGPK